MSRKQIQAANRYQDVRLLIYSTVKNFYVRYGGDFEEYLSEALYLFIKASYKFDRDRGTKFSTHMRNTIWRGLLDFCKQRWKHNEPLLDDLISAELIVVPTYSDRHIRFITELMDFLNDDAQFVVRTILNPDLKLKMRMINNTGVRVERRALRAHLITHHKWTDDRVDDAYWDIKVALYT